MDYEDCSFIEMLLPLDPRGYSVGTNRSMAFAHDAFEWCRLNIGPVEEQWAFSMAPLDIMFIFKNDRDAMTFMLVFSHQYQLSVLE